MILNFTGLVKDSGNFNYHLFSDIIADTNNTEQPKSSDMTNNLTQENKHGNLILNQIRSLNDNDLPSGDLTNTEPHAVKNKCFNIYWRKFRCC